MTTNDELVEKYAALIEPLLPLAKKAYGSRDTVSPQHDASRKYTALLKEFHEAGGSLMDLGARLGVTYAGMRRRITTADTPPAAKRPRRKFTDEEYKTAVENILDAKMLSTDDYHKRLKHYFDRGYSMARLAKEMGLSSANPLYYGVYRVRIDDEEGEG